jgi:hypothetical protein
MRVSVAVAALFGACCKGEENAFFLCSLEDLNRHFSRTGADEWRDQAGYFVNPRRNPLPLAPHSATLVHGSKIASYKGFCENRRYVWERDATGRIHEGTGRVSSSMENKCGGGPQEEQGVSG